MAVRVCNLSIGQESEGRQVLKAQCGRTLTHTHCYLPQVNINLDILQLALRRNTRLGGVTTSPYCTHTHIVVGEALVMEEHRPKGQD